jgi:hypothetical protein
MINLTWHFADCLFFFKFALQYAIRRVLLNHDGLKLNGKHELLVYAGYINAVCGSLHTAKETQNL